METPSSTRRVTRSQTLAASSARKVEESDKTVPKSMQKSSKNQQQDRSALIDITNDSPIVGLAMGSLKTTPSSALSKKRMNNQGQFTRTPGSGEALLRGQVKTLLQKVEEEAELSKITLENRPLFDLQGLITSPINLVAPTPANTPQIFCLSTNADDGLPSATPVTENFLIPQMLNEKKQGKIEPEIQITRSLSFDFSEKSDKSDASDCSSVLTYKGLVCGERESSREEEPTDEGDNSSIWSIQANASSTKEDDDDEEMESCTIEEYYEEEEEEEEEEYGFGDNAWLVDDVCEGMSKISVKELPKFEGKHIRFIYNSDGEIEREEECV